MDILLVSHRDSCRSRIAQALLQSFGRGIKVFTCGTEPQEGISKPTEELLKEKGCDPSPKAAVSLKEMACRKWGYVVTLCNEARKAVENDNIPVCEYLRHLDFPETAEDPAAMEELYGKIFHDLFRLWRDDIQDNVMPSCTCGANTYCRCE